MKEIGGYFGFEELRGGEFYPQLVALNSGRNALLYLIKAHNIKKLVLPAFLCDCVEKVCKENFVNTTYYHIDKDFHPQFEQKLGANEWLYIVNYFGLLTDEFILKEKEKYGKVIVDNAQAFFRKPLKDIDTIYTCRKFFGVSDGAYLQTGKYLLDNLEQDMSLDRVKYLFGRYEVTADAFYADFLQNEEAFSTMPLRKMSKITQNILRGIDYEFVVNRRRKNFEALHKHFGNDNAISINNFPEGPFAYPLYRENGLCIRKKLSEKGIYIPILWPNVLESKMASTLEKSYASCILPLPCDQRYGQAEIMRIMEEIKYVQ